MNFNIIKNWEYSDLVAWLKSVNVQECSQYDWKSKIDIDPNKLRRIFCAFANANGGLIFFGVNNKKKITGIKEDIELKTKINRIVNSNILPPVPINNWDISAIKIPKKKLVVYIVYVLPSLYLEKPHVTEYRIYIRGNGENQLLNDGSQIRRLFLIEKFQPDHIDQLKNELNRIKNCRFHPDQIDFMYLKQMKEYLEDGIKNNKKFGELSSSLARIIESYEKIRKNQIESETKGESLTVLDSEPLIEQINNLEKELNNFYNRFKEIHNL
jgi:predicted HTH transcriptional regulator